MSQLVSVFVLQSLATTSVDVQYDLGSVEKIRQINCYLTFIRSTSNHGITMLSRASIIKV